MGKLAPKYTAAEFGRRYPHRPLAVNERLLDALGKAPLQQSRRLLP
jgi:hypothetical protein